MTDNALKIIKDELDRIANLHKPQKLENSTITVSGCPCTETLTKALSVAANALDNCTGEDIAPCEGIYKAEIAQDALKTIVYILSGGKDGK